MHHAYRTSSKKNYKFDYCQFRVSGSLSETGILLYGSLSVTNNVGRDRQ